MTPEYRFFKVEGDYFCANEDDQVYKLNIPQSDEDIPDSIESENDIDDKINDISEDSETLPSETVKHPRSFKAWCKSKGLLDKDGDVGEKCIKAGLESGSEKIQARAKLARGFATMRKKKDFENISYDMIIDMIDDALDLKEIDTDSNLTTNIASLDKGDENAIKNKNEIQNNMDFEMKETSKTKPDGSHAMYERRVSQCMEEGKSREVCLKEVRKEMKEKGAEVVNTGDNIETKKVEVDETTVEGIKEEKDTIEVCKKEYDFLKEKVKELDALKQEKEDTEKEFESFKKDFLAFKTKVEKKEAAEREAKRQEVLKRISNDFDIPEEELQEDSMEELTKLEKRLDMALKRDLEDENEEEDFDIDTQGKRILKRYELEV